MSRDLVERAALNNALWCDAVSKAWGQAGEFHDGYWVHRFGAPRLYPDVVTLKGDESALEQIDAISKLVQSASLRDCHVKDSFGRLDLNERGFSILFEASWIAVAPDVALLPEVDSLSWGLVGDEAALADWESGWAGRTGTPDQRIFKPWLLSQPDIRFVNARRDGVLAGGGILNFGAGVVGVSNVFASKGLSPDIWGGLLGLARRTRPEAPVVGYEQEGDDWESALRAGFDEIGRLRVWRRSASIRG